MRFKVYRNSKFVKDIDVEQKYTWGLEHVEGVQVGDILETYDGGAKLEVLSNNPVGQIRSGIITKVAD